METPFPYGETFPLWRSLALMEKPFLYGEVFPFWRSLSLMEKRITCYDVNDLFMRLSSAGHVAVTLMALAPVVSMSQLGVYRRCLSVVFWWQAS